MLRGVVGPGYSPLLMHNVIRAEHIDNSTLVVELRSKFGSAPAVSHGLPQKLLVRRKRTP